MTTTKNKKTDAERDKLREDIAPIVAFADAHSGFSKELLSRLQMRCAAKPPSRQALGEWLRRDPEVRKQPRYGMGAVLVEEARELMANNWGGTQRQVPEKWPKKARKIVAKKACKDSENRVI